MMIPTDELNRHGVPRFETEQERRERITKTYPGSGTLGHLSEPSRLEKEISLLFDRHETFHAVIAHIKKLETQWDELTVVLQRISGRFFNFDNQHPSLATNEAARQLLADIEADIASVLTPPNTDSRS